MIGTRCYSRSVWLCCGEVVSCVVGDQDSAALEGDNYTTYCLPHCSPWATLNEVRCIKLGKWKAVSEFSTYILLVLNSRGRASPGWGAIMPGSTPLL